ncbi:MAG: hypothetical protein ACK4GC_01815, partial [Paracoccaceae bacterium]
MRPSSMRSRPSPTHGRAGMSIDFGNPDRPNSYIGRTVPRPNAPRLVQGRGRYVDDMV